jgi:hypothetical protein
MIRMAISPRFDTSSFMFLSLQLFCFFIWRVPDPAPSSHRFLGE